MPNFEKVTFAGTGGAALAGRLDLPAGPPRAVALFAHCFTCGKDVVAASRISRALTERGVAVLRFDFTGLGESDGEFANSTFSSNVDDLVWAADHLRATLDAPTLLVGHSLGGAAVLAAAHRIPEVRAVATIGAPADPSHVSGLFDQQRADIETDGEATVWLAGRSFRVRRQYLADIAHQPQQERIAQLGAPSSSCTRPQTRSSASTTPASSTRRRGTRSRSSASTTPTTCSASPATPSTPRR